MKKKDVVGFIGLGDMGGPMAKRIAEKGYALKVYDIDQAKTEGLSKGYENVSKAGGIKEIAEGCDIVITMLPDAKTVKGVCMGENGLFSSMKRGSIWIDTTTGDPFLAEKLAQAAKERGVDALDSPCGRSPKHAENGDLLFLVGGEERVLEAARPILTCMASEIILCGGNGTGDTMKLINNLLSGVIQEANIEAISLGIKAGISVSTMLRVFSRVGVWNGYLAALPTEVESAPGWKVKTAAEHMELVQKLGDRYQVPTYTPAVVRERMKEMIARGEGDAKYSNIKTLMKSMAGIEIKEPIEDPGIKEH